MRLFLERYQYDDKQTLGKLYLLDSKDHIIEDWHSLELPNKKNKRRVSCIPEGVYKARKHNSPRFGRCFWLQNVPNRSEILIHKGNYHSDILGCILIGNDLSDINKDGYLDVTSSKKAIKELLKLTKDIDGIMIEIKHISS
jgi:hypothetical protein